MKNKKNGGTHADLDNKGTEWLPNFLKMHDKSCSGFMLKRKT